MSNEQLKYEILGYTNYNKRTSYKDFDKISYESIIEHRNNIFQKYKDGDKHLLDSNIGAARTEGFFIPIDYDGVFVDSDDIFAATYIKKFKMRVDINLTVTYDLWILFSNDPYIPVIPLVFMKKIGILRLFSGKTNSNYLYTIKDACKNLQYPITDIDNFEKTIMSEQSPRGKVKKDFILKQLADAKKRTGLFDSDNFTYEIGGATRKFLESNGYIL